MKRTVFLLSTILFSGFLLSQPVCIDFDGSNDYAVTPNASSLIVGSSFSMAFWVYPTNGSPSFPNFDGIAGFRNNSNADFYILHLNSTQVEARFRNSGGTNYDILGTIAANQWQHFAFTYNGSTLAFYRNGVLNSSRTATGSMTSTAEDLYLGRLSFGTTNFQFDGRLDDFTLWSKALSAAEVSCLYEYGVDTSSNNLELYYHMDQGRPNKNNSGLDTLVDRMGNLNADLMNSSLSGNASNWINGYNTHTYLQEDICEGDSVLFGSLYASETGRYLRSVQSSSCDSIIQLDLTVHPPDSLGDSVRICFGESVEFNGQTIDTEGQYVFSGSSQFGCDSTFVLNLYVDTVNINVERTNNSVVSKADTAISTYQWYDCDGDSIIPGETKHFFIYSDHGNYAVIVNQKNCTDTSECVNTVLGVSEFEFISRLKLYPNPTDGSILFDYSGKEKISKIRVMNSIGLLVQEKEFSNVQSNELELVSDGINILLFYSQNSYLGQLRVLKK